MSLMRSLRRKNQKAPRLADIVRPLLPKPGKVIGLGTMTAMLREVVESAGCEYVDSQDPTTDPAPVYDCALAVRCFERIEHDDFFATLLRSVHGSIGPEGRLIVVDMQPVESPPEGVFPRGPLAFIQAWPSGGVHVLGAEHDGCWIGWLDKKKRGAP